MHNFIVIDDDKTVTSVLIKIIEQYDLGEVCAESDDGIRGEDMILIHRPDIVIIDLLLPSKDGISVVKKVKSFDLDTVFIMLSQVSTKDIIAKAYENGIEFFINKPINVIEVVNVIKRVKEYITLRKTFQTIESAASLLKKGEKLYSNDVTEKNKKVINQIMADIGILGELASKDIINMSLMLMENEDLNNRLEEIQLNDLLRIYQEKYSSGSTYAQSEIKTVEMRIRRAISKSIKNIASMGIEDFANEKFLLYSSSLFDYMDIKSEMDYIRGKSNTGGRVNVKSFFRKLLVLIEKYNNPLN